MGVLYVLLYLGLSLHSCFLFYFGRKVDNLTWFQLFLGISSLGKRSNLQRLVCTLRLAVTLGVLGKVRRITMHDCSLSEHSG